MTLIFRKQISLLSLPPNLTIRIRTIVKADVVSDFTNLRLQRLIGGESLMDLLLNYDLSINYSAMLTNSVQVPF